MRTVAAILIMIAMVSAAHAIWKPTIRNLAIAFFVFLFARFIPFLASMP